MAIAMQSKPGPMFAIEAGTLIRTYPSSALRAPPPNEWRGVLFSQLQDLSDCAGISVQLNGRFNVFQRRVGIFEPGTGQHHDCDGVLLDFSLAHQAKEQCQRSRRRRLSEQSF